MADPHPPETQPPSNPPKKEARILTRAEFTEGKQIGKGTFAEVFKVKRLSDGKKFALKQLEKSRLVQLNKTKIAVHESRIMQTLRHPNIIQLYAAFSDAKYLYFLLELGVGTLQNLETTVLNLQTIKFCAAEILDAIDYIHRHKYIHRDLKPENILIGVTGHMKITDFGSAVQSDNVGDNITLEVTNESLVGTPLYVSPEVLNGNKATAASDMWAFGCILYFLYASRPPFSGQTHYLLFKNITEGVYSFDLPDVTPADGVRPSFDPQARDLIENILRLDPLQRLTVAQAKAHPYFADTDFAKLRDTIPSTLQDFSAQPSPPSTPHIFISQPPRTESMSDFQDYVGKRQVKRVLLKDTGQNTPLLMSPRVRNAGTYGVSLPDLQNQQWMPLSPTMVHPIGWRVKSPDQPFKPAFPPLPTIDSAVTFTQTSSQQPITPTTSPQLTDVDVPPISLSPQMMNRTQKPLSRQNSLSRSLVVTPFTTHDEDLPPKPLSANKVQHGFAVRSDRPPTAHQQHPSKSTSNLRRISYSQPIQPFSTPYTLIPSDFSPHTATTDPSPGTVTARVSTDRPTSEFIDSFHKRLQQAREQNGLDTVCLPGHLFLINPVSYQSFQFFESQRLLHQSLADDESGGSSIVDDVGGSISDSDAGFSNIDFVTFEENPAPTIKRYMSKSMRLTPPLPPPSLDSFNHPSTPGMKHSHVPFAEKEQRSHSFNLRPSMRITHPTSKKITFAQLTDPVVIAQNFISTLNPPHPDQTAQFTQFLFPGEQIIYMGLILKRVGLFSKLRQLILTTQYRLLYVDISTNQLKGEIPLRDTTNPETKDLTHFIVHTPNRDYKLEDPNSHAQLWVDLIKAVCVLKTHAAQGQPAQ
ncbi:putative 3-phosphoinositide-dependent protein kinase 1 [Blattamonas nauphoetae]|uniref:non-specific serine/threonine protein kinase n=1 Tax=Blattamonas nauphoetae TaxID=2049346 RepID=A0ABQ9XKG8_9EUKA|nr:putative 3-phosphoinositide-dependent protein kinase 1 [Blattamonas nauphoetae]